MKAILILDEMPKGCDYCHYCRWSNTLDGDYCEANIGALKRIGEGGYYGEGVKPSWCPLKPMPEKEVYIVPDTLEDLKVSKQLEMAYCKGWNACIKAMRGEEE